VRRSSFALVAAASLLAACATFGVSGPPSDEARAMLAAVNGLAGDWEGNYGGQTVVTRFEPSSHGSAVREILFAGSPEEMTNVYHLDGPSLLMTHYCAMGTQPRLRARSLEGGRIEFALDSVTNRASADEPIMAGLVLELVDRDHLVEHWHNTGEDPSHPPADFRFTRRAASVR